MVKRPQWYLLVSINRIRTGFGTMARGGRGRTSPVCPQGLTHLLQFIPPHPPDADGGDDVALGPVRQRPAADAQRCGELAWGEKDRCRCCCRSRPGGGGRLRRQVGDRVQCHKSACQVVEFSQIHCWYEPAVISWYDILLGARFGKSTNFMLKGKKALPEASHSWLFQGSGWYGVVFPERERWQIHASRTSLFGVRLRNPERLELPLSSVSR